jgi:hypothetical protein
MAYSTSIKKFNWVTTPSAYESAQSWKEKRSAMVSDFQNASYNLANSFTTAIINQSIGMGNLTANAAISRMQNEAKGTTNSASTAKFDFSI